MFYVRGPKEDIPMVIPWEEATEEEIVETFISNLSLEDLFCIKAVSDIRLRLTPKLTSGSECDGDNKVFWEIAMPILQNWDANYAGTFTVPTLRIDPGPTPSPQGPPTSTPPHNTDPNLTERRPAHPWQLSPEARYLGLLHAAQVTVTVST